MSSPCPPPPALNFRCVATTGPTYNKPIQQCSASSPPNQKRRRIAPYKPPSNPFRSATFSADGTTLLTHNEDATLRTFILPPDLLTATTPPPSPLRPYASTRSPTPFLTYTLYPHFSLAEPSTTLALTSARDVPLALRNTLHYPTLHASYPHVDPGTEAFIAPHSLAWNRAGTHFVAGSRDQVAVFDAARDGEGAVMVHRTVPGRTARKRFGAKGANSCKGIVSALSFDPEGGLLAAGTLERNVGLFDHQGFGECGTAFSLPASPAGGGGGGSRAGTGITHLRWSPSGTYLLVAERQSDVVHVYDVRSTHRRVGWLAGRRAETTQKLGIDVVRTAEGFEVWAGGTDGCVRMWRNAGVAREGEQVPDNEVELHDDPISSAIWHPTGSVLATCSGRRGTSVEAGGDSSDSDDPDGGAFDNTLRVWSV